MEAYCNRQGKSMDDVRFWFDGVQIEEAQTPAQLDMEDGDVRSSVEPLTLYLSPSQIVCPRVRQIIYVIKHAKKRKSSSGTSSGTSSESIQVRTIDENGNAILFALKPTTPLQHLMQAYCNRQGMDMKNLRFMYDGKRIEGAQTPATSIWRTGTLSLWKLCCSRGGRVSWVRGDLLRLAQN